MFAICPGFRRRSIRATPALGALGLTEPRAAARLGDFEDERELLLQRVVFAADLRVLQQHCLKVFQLCHVISLARSRASSSSRGGVVCVFLMNTRTTMTRRP